MPVANKKDFLVLYGSQTGQSEAISEEIFEKGWKQGFQPARYSLADVDKKFCIDKETCIVFVCSTTGDGEPPDPALKFVRRIRKKTLSSTYLAHLSYAILALGDTNYTNFCACGKLIDERLQQLGATHFYNTGHADDAVGLEKVVEPWIEGLYPAIRNHLNKEGSLTNVNIKTDVINELVMAKNNEEQSSKTNNHKEETIDGNLHKCSLKYSNDMENLTLKIPSVSDPFLKINWLNEEIELSDKVDLPNAMAKMEKASIIKARSLTYDYTKVKHTLELELAIEGSAFEYKPGDSFGIICKNRKEEVDYLITRLKIENKCDRSLKLSILEKTKKKGAKIPSHLLLPTTLRHIFTKDVDFRAVPRKGFLRMLLDYTHDTHEKRRLQELCSSQGTKEYGELIREPLIGFLEILKTFRTCEPPIERVLEFLPRLMPREYSMSSSSQLHPNQLKFVFNVIELPEFESKKRYGLCTKWLEDITKEFCIENKSLEDKVQNMTIDYPKINVYLRRPTNFRFPEDPTKPLIMIGPGTGVAPYIGFLEERDFLKSQSTDLMLGTSILFFGCRYEDKDFLYKNELLHFKESGILDELYTSFSRDEPKSSEQTRYVQENIHKQKTKLIHLIFENEGAVYICGDAKHMGRDVTNLFVELIEEYKKLTKAEALKIMAELRENKQFLEDVWT